MKIPSPSSNGVHRTGLARPESATPARLSLGCAGMLLLSLGSLLTCRAANSHDDHEARALGDTSAKVSAAVTVRTSPPQRPRLELAWDPVTGKGHVIHHLQSGNYLRTCFHCDYPGYTGGLLIGGFGASGMALYPAVPIHGHRHINLLCAQDESLWDHTEQREYSYGWSENFGSGPDGVRLEYVGGKVLEHTPERIVLVSENRAGCYVIDKVATTTAETKYWILATRITNRCGHEVRFDFYSGDDPWLGLYRTAAGDVGWTPNGIVRRETAFRAGEVAAAGLYDLGNTAAGEHEGDFTNQANFFTFDPALPLPDFLAFANSFAHHRRNVDPRSALDDDTMTALNLGWHGITLPTNEGITVAFAIGHADTGDRVGEIPRHPIIPLSEWSRWRVAIPSGRGAPRTGVDFSAERVEMDISDTELRVKGRYILENHDRATVAMSIRYPILTSSTQLPPTELLVDERPSPLTSANNRAGLLIPVTIGPRQIAAFQVQYRQKLLARRAAYLVTSALNWRHPIGRAELIVRHGSSIKHVRLSYPSTFTRQPGETIEHTIVRQPFVPDRELEVFW